MLGLPFITLCGKFVEPVFFLRAPMLLRSRASLVKRRLNVPVLFTALLIESAWQ